MDFNQLLKQAQQMQKSVDQGKKDLEDKEYPITSQNDLISGVMNGKMEIKKLTINPVLLEDKEMLEDLLTLSLNRVIKEITEEKEKALNDLTQGVDVSAFL